MILMLLRVITIIKIRCLKQFIKVRFLFTLPQEAAYVTNAEMCELTIFIFNNHC